MKTEEELMQKLIAVISSCETQGQLEGLYDYLQRLAKVQVLTKDMFLDCERTVREHGERLDDVQKTKGEKQCKQSM